MSLKKRLAHLELESMFAANRERRLFESSQRDLCCPLPAEITDAEYDEALRLLTVGKQSLPHQVPLIAFKDYAIGLHRKYDGEYSDA